MTLRLEDREMIRQQKARYCRFLDTKQFDAWERIFKPDARIVFHDTGGSVVAEFDCAADFSRLTRDLFSTTRTIHQAHHAEIAFQSETEASAIWSMEDWHVEVSSGEDAPKTMHGYGFYHETWHRIDDEWRLARMELHRNIVFE